MSEHQLGRSAKGNWSWLPERMPGVVRLMADKRRELGSEWVNTCWTRGVTRGEPGWFWAAEAGLAVGTLWVDAAQALLEAAELGASQAPVLVLRPREDAHA